MYKDHEPEIKVDLARSACLSSFMQAGVKCSLMPGSHLSSKLNLVLSASLAVLSQQSWFQTHACRLFVNLVPLCGYNASELIQPSHKEMHLAMVTTDHCRGCNESAVYCHFIGQQVRIKVYSHLTVVPISQL